MDKHYQKEKGNGIRQRSTGIRDIERLPEVAGRPLKTMLGQLTICTKLFQTIIRVVVSFVNSSVVPSGAAGTVRVL